MPAIVTAHATTEVAGARFERSRGALPRTGGGGELAPVGVFLVGVGAVPRALVPVAPAPASVCVSRTIQPR